VFEKLRILGLWLGVNSGVLDGALGRGVWGSGA
jgi:hypothetical protein